VDSPRALGSPPTPSVAGSGRACCRLRPSSSRVEPAGRAATDTLAWVEGVVESAEEEGLVGGKPACIENTDFIARARELHRRLFG